MDHEYKFQPGQIFKLTPTAKIQWVACEQSQGGIGAVRCDSPTGKKILRWLAKGKPAMDHDSVVDMQQAIHKEKRDFWSHHLAAAVAVNMMQL
jgi:hypothetical protein